MLKSFQMDNTFRCLDANPFDETGFGQKTVIYGHNGSGKSTLSFVLANLQTNSLDRRVTWTGSDRNKKNTIVTKTALPDGAIISVFNKDYVRDNLLKFLDGQDATAIISLGGAVDAKKEETKIFNELTKLKSDLKLKKPTYKALSETTSSLVRNVQELIVSGLRTHDLTVTKNKYNDPFLRKSLDTAKFVAFPDSSKDKFLNELDEPARGPMQPQPLPNILWTNLLDDTKSLLSRGVDSELISSLIGDPELQKWVFQGLEIHAERRECSFCANPLDEERKIALRKHFDESRKRLQNDVHTMLVKILKYRTDLTTWKDALPAIDTVHPSLRDLLPGLAEAQQSSYDTAVGQLDALESVLTQKFDQPEETVFEVPEILEIDFLMCSSDSLYEQHDALNATHTQNRNMLVKKVINGITGAYSDRYREALSKESKAGTACATLEKQIALLEPKLAEVRAKQFTSQKMADQINEDLASVYGRHHLRIQVTADGKNYRCLRTNGPASDLSEGERNTLALIYFLRQLQDESVAQDPKKRIVVVDDPSSSLDRESIYATHSWLLKQLSLYGQYIILTHDFELLRLLLGSHRSQVGKTRSTIHRPNRPNATPQDISKAADQQHYPLVQFLELSARTVSDGSRMSTITSLPNYIVDHISEYHYIFDRVMRGIEGEDEEALFLLPNAARRMLESFSRFKRPDISDFLQAMEAMTDEDTFRDVYDFCNKHSHGEGRELSLPLDRTLVKIQIQRSVDFMVHVDKDHVEKLRKATKRAPLISA